jgi:hypothetical protein
LHGTPKAANGASTPKSAKDSSAAKAVKPKTKKAKSKEANEAVVPKEPELTPEEKRLKKEVSPFCDLSSRLSNIILERNFVPAPQAPEGPFAQRPRAQSGRYEADV